MSNDGYTNSQCGTFLFGKLLGPKRSNLLPSATGGECTCCVSEQLTKNQSQEIEKEQLLTTVDESVCYCGEPHQTNRSNESADLQASHDETNEPNEKAFKHLNTDKTTANPSKYLDTDETIEKPSKRDTDETIEKSVQHRILALKELRDTEEEYVQKLSLIVDGYIREIHSAKSDIPLPDDLKGGEYRKVFANIEAICEWHRDTLLKSLRKTTLNDLDLGALMKRSKSKLIRLYVTFIENKPISERIVANNKDYFAKIESKLMYDLPIGAWLIKPIQRIHHYKLLFDRILTFTRRAGLVREIPKLECAIGIMEAILEQTNVMQSVQQLKNVGGSRLTELLLNESLLCNKNGQFRSQMFQVFLFQQSIVFAEILCEKTKSYVYKDHMLLNRVSFCLLPDNRFSLTSTDTNRRDIRYIIISKSYEQYQNWTDTINSILQRQVDFARSLQQPQI